MLLPVHLDGNFKVISRIRRGLDGVNAVVPVRESQDLLADAKICAKLASFFVIFVTVVHARRCFCVRSIRLDVISNDLSFLSSAVGEDAGVH